MQSQPFPSSPSRTSDIRAFLHERLDALLDDCNKVGETAAYGRYIHDLDDFLYIEGRKFMREVLEKQVQAHIDHVETTDEGKQCPKCKKKTSAHSRPSKTITSSHGRLTYRRRYRHCKACKSYTFPVESLLGLDSDYTDGATRLISLGSGQWSYRATSENIQAFCGFRISHTTTGNIAAQTAVKLSERMQENTAVREEFQKAKGETSFYTDGVFVHCRDDADKPVWCEMKVGAFVKRERGGSASPAEWATRDLPEPSAVSAFAAIESKEEFQGRCKQERHRLGVGGVTSTLGDGAKWIWSLVFLLFGKTLECLDIFHAAEHIADCGKVLFGEGEESTAWFERLRLVLLSEGYLGMEGELLPLLKSLPRGKKRKKVRMLLKYFYRNRDRLCYRERLSAGRAIGSGLIEGACKNLAGWRLKQTGACWRRERANKIAVLAALLYSNQWIHAWNTST
jgi:hypothetical protein